MSSWNEEEAASKPRLITDNQGLVGSNIGKRYRKRPVLRDVSLGVQRGESVGLLGPNGAGKTTFFYILTGLISADYGTISLDGRDITELPMYRRARLGIGYLPQEPSIFRGLSVEKNIRAVLEAVDPDRDRREALLDDLLAEFSITHLRQILTRLGVLLVTEQLALAKAASAFDRDGNLAGERDAGLLDAACRSLVEKATLLG